MNENRASVPGTAAADIVIEHGDRVVKAILAPKLFRAGRVRQPDRAVVVAVGGRIAPAQPGAQRADWQRRAGPPQAVRPVMYPHGRPEAVRACSIALALQGTHAALANRDRKMQIPELQYPNGGPVR